MQTATAIRPAIQERNAVTLPGPLMLLLGITLLGIAVLWGTQAVMNVRFPFVGGGVSLCCMAMGIFVFTGLTSIRVNEALVTTLFGNYTGTVTDNGLKWIFPLCSTERINMALRVLENAPTKVNDANGNPIEMGGVVTWHVDGAAQATFGADDYEEFVAKKAESAFRSVASSHPYEEFEDIEKNPSSAKAAANGNPAEHAAKDAHPVAKLTLRGHNEEISAEIVKALSKTCRPLGIVIDEAQITHLSYAPEIASSMLRRQQASAITAARKIILFNAVSMAKEAAEAIAKGENGEPGIPLEPERKAAFVSNLVTVMVSEREATPVLNVGTLHG